MKLLRYNSEPVDIDVNNIQSIDALNNCMLVTTKDGSVYKGYYLKQ